MNSFVNLLDRFAWSNPYSVGAMLLVAAFFGLLWFTIALDRTKPDVRDWRYFRNLSIRNHLWIVYFAAIMFFLMLAL